MRREPLPINTAGLPVTVDMTDVVFGRKGEKTEHQRYYYVPNGEGVKRERAVIACTVHGAVGPFTMTRTVSYGEWELDPTDDRREDRVQSRRSERKDS
ncbi:MAG TPA: hypothetical protein VLJ88_15880 [Propionibacteriaceae bacterium]|nr:hypothetical protein [Propionibacteriaceae bacterium]